MSKTIYKYDLAIGSNIRTMPKGAIIIHVGNQAETLTIWVEVDPRQPEEARHFLTIGTGHPIPPNDTLMYIGTALFAGGSLVWHVYEIMP